MEWMLILPTLLAGIGAGYSDRDIVEQLSDEERARLDSLFGNAEEFIGELRGLPEIGGLSDLTFTGALGGQSSGPQLSKDFNPKDSSTQNLTELGNSPDEIFDNIFKELKAAIPQTPSVGQGVDIPSLNIQDVLDELSGLGGGFLKRGDLVNRIPEMGELPSADFSALRSQLGETIRGAAQQRAGTESEQARRSLLASGITPGSATFDFETNLAPKRRAEESIDQQTIAMNAELEKAQRELGFKKAELELGQQTNLTNAASVEEQTIAQQFGTIADLFKASTELGLKGAELKLNSNQQDIANDFQQWGSQLGVTQEQFQQFSSLLAQNSNLSLAAQGMIAEMLRAEIAAELEATGSTVLTSDIFSNAMGMANQAANIFGLLEGSKPKSSSGFSASILGTGGGFNQGCVAGCTPVITPKGLVWLAKIQIGDYVLGADGHYHRVQGLEYGTLQPQERLHPHRILKTHYGGLWITDNHTVYGKAAKLWKPGDVLPVFTRRGKVDAKIIQVDEDVAYVPSGDLYLESGVPYIAGGFIVHSVIRPAKTKAA